MLNKESSAGLLIYTQTDASASGIVKAGISVLNAGRLKSISIETTGTITAGATATFRLGGILNALLSSFSLTSSKYGNIVANAKGSDLFIINMARPNGKENYASFGTTAATAARVTHTTNYNPAAWVNLTSYYMEAHFEYSMERFSPDQPENLFYMDTAKDTLTIDIAVMDKINTLFSTGPTGGTVTASSVDIYGFYTDAPEYNAEVKVYANARHVQTGQVQQLITPFYEWSAKKQVMLGSGYIIEAEQSVGPHPAYSEGRVRKVLTKSQSNSSLGSNTIEVVKDNTPREYESLVFTGQNNATPFAPAVGTNVTEIFVKLTDGVTTAETNLVKKKGEYIQHDAFTETNNIDMTGVFPLIFSGKKYGTKFGYNAKDINKVVADQTTLAAIDFSSILTHAVHATK